MKHNIFGISSDGNKTITDNFHSLENYSDTTQTYVSKDVFQAYLGNKRIDFRLLVEVMDSVEYDDNLNVINVQLNLVPDYKCLNKRFKEQVKNDIGGEGADYLKKIEMFEYLHGEGIEVVLGYEAIPYTERKDDVLHYDETKKALDAIANTYSAVGHMIGFWLDKPANRIGNTGWDYLSYFCGNKKRLF